MRSRLLLSAVVLFLPATAQLLAQKAPRPPANSGKLELSSEVATTTEEGCPSSVRVTITNVGYTPAIMPTLRQGLCGPERGIHVVMTWTAADRHSGSGGSWDDCVGSGLTVQSLIRRSWVLLRPGEFMTETIDLRGRYSDYQPGTVTYHIEYLPPAASPKDIAGQAALGYFIPTEALATADESFDLQ